tara:strand:+ start:284 stop:385 length:102 start_codon:yes stop_codon:yes gene_type:complete
MKVSDMKYMSKEDLIQLMVDWDMIEDDTKGEDE